MGRELGHKNSIKETHQKILGPWMLFGREQHTYTLAKDKVNSKLSRVFSQIKMAHFSLSKGSAA